MTADLVVRSMLTANAGVLTIDRADRSNSLTPQMAIALESALLALEADPAVRVIFLRGAGGRAFCGGYDLSGVSAGIRDAEVQSLLRTLRGLSVPTVAVVDGHAVGVGLDLACSCDLRIVRSGVKIGLPAVRIGVAYDADGLRQILARAPGARRLLLTGELGFAEDLLGFADVLVDADHIETEVALLADALTAASPAALAYMTAMVRPDGPDRLDVKATREWRHRVLDGPDAQTSAEVRTNGSVPAFADRIPVDPTESRSR